MIRFLAACCAVAALLSTWSRSGLADGALPLTPPASAAPWASAPRGSPTVQPGKPASSAPAMPSVVAPVMLVEQPPAPPASAETPSALPAAQSTAPLQADAQSVPAPLFDASVKDEAVQTPEDLWARIRAGFAMREIDSPLVQRHEAWYLNRPEYVERMIDRSRRYLYFIVEEVEKRGMPTEIALLPMIESAYNPTALSHMRAAGMWQFIPSTGKRYGLQQTWWYDGRRDVLAATRAALDYLQALHDMFGDWELALAAYNWGEGAVQRAVEKNRRKGKPTDYMSLTMPRETRNYLPKLQAVKNIVANPELFELTLAPLPNQPYFAVVNAPAHMDVAVAARLAGVPVDEFRSLNPGHQRPVITADRAQLLVPVDKVDTFQANLEKNDQPLVTWQTYQLKKGEKLEHVAAKFDISLARLKEVNGLTRTKRTRPGQMLLVPMEDDATTNLDETYTSSDFEAPADDYHKRTIYRVKRGDTLNSIARRYGTSVGQIKAWNALHANSVRTGQRLTIWQYGPPARAHKAGHKSKSKSVHKGRHPHPTTTAGQAPTRKLAGG
jgi:membrane-bound lytic murein transglycosylase D